MRYEIALLAGLALIIVVLGFFGLAEIAATLLSADFRFVALAVLVELAFIFLLSLRLNIISNSSVGFRKNLKEIHKKPAALAAGYKEDFISRRHGRISLKDTMEINTIGLFAGFLSPLARIGGEPVKVYLLKGRLGGTKSSAVVAIDTLVEVFSLYVLVIVAAMMLSAQIPQSVFPPLFVFLFLSVYASLIFLKICTSEKWLGDFLGWLSRFPRFSRLREKDYASMFHSSFAALASDRKLLLASFFLSVFSKLLELLRIWIIFMALHQDISFSMAALFWAFLLILSAIPFLPGGLGLVEGGGIFALILLGIEKSVAASAVLLERFVAYWLVLLIGFIVISRSRHTYAALKKIRH